MKKDSEWANREIEYAETLESGLSGSTRTAQINVRLWSIPPSDDLDLDERVFGSIFAKQIIAR